MKKFLKVLVIIVLIFMAVLIILPFAFKGKIITTVKKAANDNLNAKLEFADLSLSFLRNFPNLTVRLDSLSIEGKEPFLHDTLISVPKLRISINLMSILKGSKYEIRTVDINDARIFLKVLADGTANWNIMKEDTTVRVDTTAKASQFDIKLKSFTINNSLLVYDDASIPTFVRAVGLNSNISGDLRNVITDLDTKTTVDNILINYDGINYLSNSKARLESKISADLDKFKFTFPDAHLFLNELELLAKGFFAMPTDTYEMDIQFEAVKSDFKNFLSLVPAIYSKDFDKVQTSGTLAFKGYVKGKYDDKNIPAFGINLNVNNGKFKYPDLPGTADNINIIALIDNKTGNPDATTIDVSKFHVEMMDNQVDAVIHARNPVSDPYLDAVVKGKVNLADVSKIYPLEKGDNLSGLIVADFAIKGKQSDAENQRFNDFKANGHISLTDVNYNTKSIAESVSISKALFNLTPSEISMPEMNVKMGKNDLAANGRLTNYLAYAFKKGELVGVMNMQSQYFNLNDFMTDTTAAKSDTAASKLSVIEIPKGIDFQLNSSFNKVIYDKLELTNATGVLRVKDQVLSLQNLKFNTMQGQMILNGNYSTKDVTKPSLDMAMNISGIEVSKAFENFNTVQKLAPIAKQTSGKISSNLRISTTLGKDMMPLPATLQGEGSLTSPSLSINNVNTFNKIADALKLDQLKKWSLDKINLSFAIEAGKVTVKPFTTKLGNFKTEISGWNSFDESLEYIMQMAIPRSTFGGAANTALENLVKQANAKGTNFSLSETVPVSLVINGNIHDPKVSVNLGKATSANLKENIKQTIEKKKEEVVGKVKEEAGKYIEEANQKAQKIIDEAQVKANQLIAAGDQSAKKIRDEANKQADQLVAEGAKNGMIAKLAAQKTAEKVRSEGDKKATSVSAEAKKQADALMATARSQADKIKAEAQQKTK